MLNGKVALVTGGGRGIGRAIAEKLADNHARVFVNYNQSQPQADDLVAKLCAQGLKAEAVKADLGDEKQIGEMYKIIREKAGRLDILVNNAGIISNNLMVMTSTEELDRLIATNCRGAFLCQRHAAKMMMRQKGGSIVNISSIMGIRGNIGQVAYGATKAFVLGMTVSGAKELGSSNIRVNAVAPGFIETDMTKDLKPEVRQQHLSKVALGRAGTPDDVAKVVLFLSSDLAGYVTGQTIVVDGCQSI